MIRKPMPVYVYPTICFDKYFNHINNDHKTKGRRLLTSAKEHGAFHIVMQPWKLGDALPPCSTREVLELEELRHLLCCQMRVANRSHYR